MFRVENKKKINFKYIVIVAFIGGLFFPSQSFSANETVQFYKLQFRHNIAYKVNETEPFTGITFRLYVNEQKELEAEFKNGKRDGLTTRWYINGQKKDR